MAEGNDAVMAEVMNLLEAEPASLPAAVPAPDIPALCEELAILMFPGKMKEAISVDLTQKIEKLIIAFMLNHQVMLLGELDWHSIPFSRQRCVTVGRMLPYSVMVAQTRPT